MEKELTVRNVHIDIGCDRPIRIVQMTDLHLNAINDRDREENNPLTIASYNDPRNWLRDGASLPNIMRCLEWAKDADQIVLTGDLISYLSYGNLELLKINIWDQYDNVMACVGNHVILLIPDVDLEQFKIAV